MAPVPVTGQGGGRLAVLKFVVVRFLHGILVLLGVLVFIFVISRLSGDPVALMVDPSVQHAERERLRQQLGLNDPLYLQFARYMGDALRGDFGTSIQSRVPALDLVLERMPATVELTLFAIAFGVALGILLGVLSALRQNSWTDYLGMGFTLVGQSVPSFWLGIMFIMYFGVQLRLFPISGRGTFAHLIMPGVTLGVGVMAIVAKFTRSSMIEVLGSNYLVFARAKGLQEWVLITRHALRNALIPVATVVGLSFSGLLSGAVITEQIFAWPGLGRLAVRAIYGRDFPVIQAVVVVVTVIVIAVNLLVDILYTYLDPRIRYE